MTRGGGAVSPLNIHAWRGFALHDRMAELTGLAVAVDNDAKALALGEGWLGAAQGVKDYLAIVVSTGVGGALSPSEDGPSAVDQGGGLLGPSDVDCEYDRHGRRT